MVCCHRVIAIPAQPKRTLAMTLGQEEEHEGSARPSLAYRACLRCTANMLPVSCLTLLFAHLQSLCIRSWARTEVSTETMRTPPLVSPCAMRNAYLGTTLLQAPGHRPWAYRLKRPSTGRSHPAAARQQLSHLARTRSRPKRAGTSSLSRP